LVLLNAPAKGARNKCELCLIFAWKNERLETLTLLEFSQGTSDTLIRRLRSLVGVAKPAVTGMPVDGKIWNITFQFRQSLRALHSYDIAGLNVFLWITSQRST
jgi:hypothetical protein